MKQKLKNNNGITLIALVITIIVMLILVTVTIRVATDGNLFKHAANAASKTKTAAEGENGILNGSGLSIEDIVGEQLGNLPKAKAGEKTSKKAQYTSNGKTAIIPAGFAVSGIESEQSIDNGLVIYYQGNAQSIDWSDYENTRRMYDQFVWIPVTNPNSMFICQDKITGVDTECNIQLVNGVPTCINHECTSMAGKLYSTSTYNNFDKELSTQVFYNDCYNNLVEPTILWNGQDNNNNITFENLSDEYKNIAKSIIENKGFWVGRYETSKMNTSVEIRAGATRNDGTCDISWFNMYNSQKNYASSKQCYGGMITGAAYDQVMMFVDGGYIFNDQSKGMFDIMVNTQVSHSIQNPYPTGNTAYPETDSRGRATAEYKDMVKNIYDLEGNLTEWTTEGYKSYRIWRGSYCSGGGNLYSSSYRGYSDYSTSSNYILGSRAALFLK